MKEINVHFNVTFFKNVMWKKKNTLDTNYYSEQNIRISFKTCLERMFKLLIFLSQQSPFVPTTRTISDYLGSAAAGGCNCDRGR